MKKILLFLPVSLLPLIAIGQGTLSHRNEFVIDKAIRTVQEAEKGYDCEHGRFVSPTTFNELTKQIFAKVVVKNNDLVTNGTAANLEIDDKTTVVSGNANFRVGRSAFWNIGLAGKTEGKMLSIFQGGSYSKGFTVSTGFDVKMKSTLFYKKEDCRKLVASRDTLERKILATLVAYKDFDTATVTREITALKEKLSLQQGSLDSIKHMLSDKDLKKYEELLLKKQDSLQFYTDHFLAEFSDCSTIKAYITEEISKAEVKTAAVNGYTLHWLSGNFSFGNQGYNIFNDSLTSHLFNDTLKSEYYRLYMLTLTYNFVWNTPRVLAYVYGGASVQNQYGLQDFKWEGNTLIGGNTAIVERNDVSALDVSSIASVYNKSYLGFTPQAGALGFFGRNKIIGGELYAAINIKSNTPQLIEYRPSYSFRAGVLFSLTKSKGVVSDGTIGLIGSINNYIPHNGRNFLDALTLGVRVGVPFRNIELQ